MTSQAPRSDEAPGSLLNADRPPVFCPGCSHEKVLHGLDRAFGTLGLGGTDIAMVSDIGCSGLFDTFFHTHAFHGLHGRVLTYAAGIKLARPELTVVATMGDGGLGIGGAHLLAACRRNLDLTLLVLNNFNFGMTGGQFSATTPSEARVGSAFLNRLEPPLDLQATATAAGAPYVVRCSTYQPDLPEILEAAIRYRGFSVVEILGICPGRYTRRNRITPKTIAAELGSTQGGEVVANARPEYGAAYREEAGRQRPARAPRGVEARHQAPGHGRQGVLVLGSAGQRVITAGELLGLAGMSAGLNVTQKSEYNITVLRGPSVAELVLSPEPIDYTGIERADVVLALAVEGVERRRGAFENLAEGALVVRVAGVELPEVPEGVRVETVDLKERGVGRADTALGALGVLAGQGRGITREMLDAALEARFKADVLAKAREVVAAAAG